MDGQGAGRRNESETPSPNNEEAAEPSTPRIHVPPPCIHPRHLAMLSPHQVQRMHRNYYRGHGVPTDEIPRNAYHSAEYYREQYNEAVQNRRADRDRVGTLGWSPATTISISESHSPRTTISDQIRSPGVTISDQSRSPGVTISERSSQSPSPSITNSERSSLSPSPSPSPSITISPRPSRSPSPRITISEVHMDDGIAPCCIVCYEDLEIGDEVRPLNCRHFFHPHCINKWFAHQRASSLPTNCPICRNSF